MLVTFEKLARVETAPKPRAIAHTALVYYTLGACFLQAICRYSGKVGLHYFIMIDFIIKCCAPF